MCAWKCTHPLREVTALSLLAGGGSRRSERLGSNWFWRFLPPLLGKLSLFHLQPDQSPVMCLSTWTPLSPPTPHACGNFVSAINLLTQANQPLFLPLGLLGCPPWATSLALAHSCLLPLALSAGFLPPFLWHPSCPIWDALSISSTSLPLSKPCVLPGTQTCLPRAPMKQEGPDTPVLWWQNVGRQAACRNCTRGSKHTRVLPSCQALLYAGTRVIQPTQP